MNTIYTTCRADNRPANEDQITKRILENATKKRHARERDAAEKTFLIATLKKALARQTARADGLADRLVKECNLVAGLQCQILNLQFELEHTRDDLTRDVNAMTGIADAFRFELEDARKQYAEDAAKIARLQGIETLIDECGHGKSVEDLIAKIERKEDRIEYLETRIPPADLFAA